MGFQQHTAFFEIVRVKENVALWDYVEKTLMIHLQESFCLQENMLILSHKELHKKHVELLWSLQLRFHNIFREIKLPPYNATLLLS